MIVRISSEGQYRMGSEHLDRLNELDNQLVECAARDDEEGFNRLFQQLLSHVRDNGKPLDTDELHESDVILPPPDITLGEAKHLFQGEGLVPD